jgi:RNA polymerase sigma-70 factor (ECF subfamily)
LSDRVATTQWSQVLAARDGSDTQARAALESLCQTYWQPLYAYIRAQAYGPDEARDLTQGFFTEFLDKDFLSSVDPDKGRFRSFLLASLRHFLSHERDRERALKRGGGTTTLSLDLETGEENYRLQVSEEMTPEDVFERRWALTVLDRAVGRLERESDEAGTSFQFGHLQQYLTGEGVPPSYRETATALGMSEAATKSAVQRLRRRLGRCLRTEIAETVADPADVDDEVRNLLSKLRP